MTSINFKSKGDNDFRKEVEKDEAIENEKKDLFKKMNQKIMVLEKLKNDEPEVNGSRKEVEKDEAFEEEEKEVEKMDLFKNEPEDNGSRKEIEPENFRDFAGQYIYDTNEDTQTADDIERIEGSDSNKFLDLHGYNNELVENDAF
ncbi:15010_t:CDS:2 [Funneliformis geosporum]|uniref:15010_t:CDS:1 n=1 Tax=Funneliformis geosporum TaxID=1117311 RepID=A0A9W4WUX4_9GLOM|nr:15010_t:CDS:2 [Funneliformis geosporum]